MWLAVLCIVNGLSDGIEFEQGLDHVSIYKLMKIDGSSGSHLRQIYT